MQGIGLSFLAALLAGCPSIPEECGQNVRKIITLDFKGPEIIKTTLAFDFAKYDVTLAIEKQDDSQPAQVCYLVREDDPWYKFFWAIDDVLDINIIKIPLGQNTLTVENHFVLWAKDDQEICWTGALLGKFKTSGCTGEQEAEIGSGSI